MKIEKVHIYRSIFNDLLRDELVCLGSMVNESMKMHILQKF